MTDARTTIEIIMFMFMLFFLYGWYYSNQTGTVCVENWKETLENYKTCAHFFLEQKKSMDKIEYLPETLPSWCSDMIIDCELDHVDNYCITRNHLFALNETLPENCIPVFRKLVGGDFTFVFCEPIVMNQCHKA